MSRTNIPGESYKSLASLHQFLKKFNENHSQGGLFQSPHEDENDVQTISHKCRVLPFDQYTEKYGPDPKQYESVYDNNDTFYLAGHYDPTSIVLTFENDIPSASKPSDKKK